MILPTAVEVNRGNVRDAGDGWGGVDHVPDEGEGDEQYTIQQRYVQRGFNGHA